MNLSGELISYIDGESIKSLDSARIISDSVLLSSQPLILLKQRGFFLLE